MILGSTPVTVVLYGKPVRTVGVEWLGYDIIRVDDAGWESDRPIVSVCVMQERDVVDYLQEHGVPHQREYGTIVLEHADAREYLENELHPRRQDAFIGALTQHPSARVQGHMTDTEAKTIEVEYTYIPGL